MTGLQDYKIKTYLAAIVGVALMFLTACEESTATEGTNDDVTKTEENLPSISDYPIVGTGQVVFYSNSSELSTVDLGNEFYGQNANYPGNVAQYEDNADGTLTDMVTGLMWLQSADIDGDGDIDADDKLTYQQAIEGASNFSLGGYSDWRLPSIKELYSLIMFYGLDPSGMEGDSEDFVPFIDTDYFDFGYGDESAGERAIDAQYATATVYTGTTMGGNKTMFGVNFADGRIKGYPIETSFNEKTYYVLYVRGNENYGINSFQDNRDGTITDNATGLMWTTIDSEAGMNWQDALQYAESLELAGYTDWRLPDAKELQSLIDYSRSPDATGTAAIDPLFSCTEITNEAGERDYPCYWTSTTHANMSNVSGGNAAYVSFGKAMGYWMYEWQDVHGAGAQRSDPKTGSADDYPTGHGPQGDAIRVQNYIRCVRTISE